jgi:DNA invertase Pin-like site-specific DNA recombinase
MAVLGYARVSTDLQSLESQLAALRQASATLIFQEKLSGSTSARPQLAKMLKSLQPGDVVLVCKIDRLCRSTRDFLNLIAEIQKAGASFKSLGEPSIDTSNGNAYSTLLMTILSAFSELERSLILSRTAEGRDFAKANCVKFGPKYKLNEFQRREALARRSNGETLTDIARSYNVSYMTISRLQDR